jgi:hypothetical protein
LSDNPLNLFSTSIFYIRKSRRAKARLHRPKAPEGLLSIKQIPRPKGYSKELWAAAAMVGFTISTANPKQSYICPAFE